LKTRNSLVAVAVISLTFASAAALADPESASPSAADETTPSMSTLHSLDRTTGGYKGWGSMANAQVPYSVSDAGRNDFTGEARERAAMLAEVSAARALVWADNAPLRAQYQSRNIGATRADAAGGQARPDRSQ
jgi:hypothetical protein